MAINLINPPKKYVITQLKETINGVDQLLQLHPRTDSDIVLYSGTIYTGSNVKAILDSEVINIKMGTQTKAGGLTITGLLSADGNLDIGANLSIESDTSNIVFTNNNEFTSTLNTETLAGNVTLLLPDMTEHPLYGTNASAGEKTVFTLATTDDLPPIDPISTLFNFTFGNVPGEENFGELVLSPFESKETDTIAFDTGTVAPSYTGRLNLNANLYTTKLNATTGIEVNEGESAVFSVDANGNTTIEGTLNVEEDVTLASDLAVNGGTLSTTATTFNIADTNATTVNAFGAATTLNVGYDGTSASVTNIATGVTATGNTKTVNIGLGADTGSTTAVNIGGSGAGVGNSTVTIYGNLNVTGTTTTINTEQLSIADNIITLNSDYTGSTPTESAGIEVNRGTEFTAATLIWDEGEDRWEINGDPIAGASNKLSFFSATSSAELAGVISDETGTGSLVFSVSPTLVTPVLGAATATSVNGLIITSTTGTLTIDANKTLTISNTLSLQGTDSSTVNFGTGGDVAYKNNSLSQFASTTSSELLTLISDETGTGSLVFSVSPTLVTPVLGVATATSINGLELSGEAGSSIDVAAGKALNFNDNLTVGTLTSGYNLYASDANTISTEQYVALVRGGTGVDNTQIASEDGQGKIFVGPSSGTGNATFRTLTNADLPDSTAEIEGMYSVVSVNSKGVVTAGQQLIEVGFIGTGPFDENNLDPNMPSEALALGGLFFQELVSA
jgi:hypothetical protein